MRVRPLHRHDLDSPNLAHNLFLEDQTAYNKKVASVLGFSSRAKWIVTSHKRPFVGYNVLMVGPDHNGYPTLKGYAIAQAFFGPFDK